MKETEQNLESLTRTSLLARNTVYNLLGQIAPLFAALLAIPILVRNLGADRFGVLGISWVVLGYFSLFDLGLGRVITKMIAEKLGSDRKEDIAPIIWTGLGFMLMLGLIMMSLLLAVSHLLVHSVLKIPQTLQDESFRAFIILAACVPIVVMTAGLRALLEAYQKFGIVNLIRMANGVMLYISPLIVLPFTLSIQYIVLVLTLVRLVVLSVYFVACRQKIPIMRNQVVFRRELIKPMLKLGGWMSVSNIIGPVMVYFDRFLMGAWLSVTAVAYYVTPYEIISKGMVITTSVVRVLFPAFSMSIQTAPQRAADLYSRGNRILLLLFFPITLTIIVFAPWGMNIWLPEFAEQGARVMQWLAIGVMINAFGQVAFAAIQAAGRPDLTAKLHLIEMPLYLLSLYFFIRWFGIVGAAMAWTMRLFFETVILFKMAEIQIKSPINKNSVTVFLVISASMLQSAIILLDIRSQFVFYLITLPSFFILAWRILIDPRERRAVKCFISRNSEIGVQN